MDDGKVLVVNLAKGALGEDSASLLVRSWFRHERGGVLPH